MAKLTKDQISFLKEQQIPESLLFDASGLSKSARELAMRTLDKKFFYGGAICQKGGHSLRTKAGHCIQCDTSRIAFQMRSSDSGYVYLCHSEATGFVKVGFSKEHPQDRAERLRDAGYGGARDWDVKRFIWLERNAGRHEFAIHYRLAAYQRLVEYEKQIGFIVECREIFGCTLEHAIEVFGHVRSLRD